MLSCVAMLAPPHQTTSKDKEPLLRPSAQQGTLLHRCCWTQNCYVAGPGECTTVIPRWI